MPVEMDKGLQKSTFDGDNSLEESTYGDFNFKKTTRKNSTKKSPDRKPVKECDVKPIVMRKIT